MADVPATTTPIDPRLEETLAAYLQAEEAGRAPDPGQWLARHPDLAPQLRAFLDNRKEVPRLWQQGPVPSRLPDIPGYEVLGEVGRGNCTVYKVRHKALKQPRALKLLREGASEEEARRFRKEAEVMASLDHANVVTVYEVGEHAGRPYFVMELAGGGTLADRLADGRLWPGRQAAELVRTLAQAVHHAHQRGIVHRDLKPANVLFTSDGTPKVADFGLAKQLDVEGPTLPEAVLGTVPYMAPEQAAGKSREAGRATDVYALGAILYKLVTGRPPFLGLAVADTLDQVRTHDPVPPQVLNPALDTDLAAICLKCLAKAPGDRYPSAEALAADLANYLAGASVSVRPPSLARWLARTVSRSWQIADFSALASRLLLLAALFFLGHLAVFFLLLRRGPEPLVWLALFAPYLGLFATFRSKHASGRQTTGPAERLLWGVWVGHLLASAAVFAAFRLARPDYVDGFLTAHPARAAVTGLAFFVMGGPFWGPNYALGVAWMLLAVLMPLALVWAPLEAGVLVGLCNLVIGLYMLRLRKRAVADRAR